MSDLERIIAELRYEATEQTSDWADRLAALAGAAPVAEVGRDLLGNPAIVSIYWDRLKHGDRLFTHAPAKAREVTPEMLRAFKSHVYAVMPTAHMPADSHIENAMRAALATFAEGE